MGDTFGCWEVTALDGKKHLIVDKAYAAAVAVAKKQFEVSDIRLIASDIKASMLQCPYHKVIVNGSPT